MTNRPVKAKVRRFEVELEGEAVGHGEVDFDSLVAFGEHFQDALRRFANVVEGRKAVVPGHPTAAASAAARFRLVGIRKGSTVLQLKTTSADWLPSAADLAIAELARQVRSPKASLERGIVDALDEARLSLGARGGFRVKSHGMKTMIINERAVTRLRTRESEQTSAEARNHVVSGWLHMADVQPNEFVIRTPLGVEWRCTFSPAMKRTVLRLIDQVVVASGTGVQTGRVGKLEIESISAAPTVYQQTLEGDAERVSGVEIPTSVRLRRSRGDGLEMTRKDVDDLLASIEEATR